MTEQKWLVCDDPARMLAFVRDRTSGRKMRLFACACCRSIWHLPPRRPRPGRGESGGALG